MTHLDYFWMVSSFYGPQQSKALPWTAEYQVAERMLINALSKLNLCIHDRCRYQFHVWVGSTDWYASYTSYLFGSVYGFAPHERFWFIFVFFRIRFRDWQFMDVPLDGQIMCRDGFFIQRTPRTTEELISATKRYEHFE